MTPILTKTFQTGAAVNGARIVKVGAADNLVVEAASAAATEFILGVSEYVKDGAGGVVSTPTGGDIDVIMVGIAYVQLGGTVARGAPVTAAATGVAVTAAPAAGTNARVLGFALVSGVTGDVIPVLINQGLMQG
jgi:hypothetical protein